MRFAVNKKYTKELLFLLRMPLQMGYTGYMREEEEFPLPLFESALEYGVYH